ncbi:hypothetical protein CYMTET_29596 [Cymbomonas tetramitiformis]|uniref:Uncharacterized protein n=1 Tax=Cymbomonas tetramitiformis TaxID=36881 RepID=A0AAE0KUS1_9CHLO|nr:hypothetical protein CYMTET_29596 [Cymbomonas tetramitiformis]
MLQNTEGSGGKRDRAEEAPPTEIEASPAHAKASQCCLEDWCTFVKAPPACAPPIEIEASPAHVNSKRACDDVPSAKGRPISEGAGRKRGRGEEDSPSEVVEPQLKRTKSERAKSALKLALMGFENKDIPPKDEGRSKSLLEAYDNIQLIYEPDHKKDSGMGHQNGTDNRNSLSLDHFEHALKQSYYSKGKEEEISEVMKEFKLKLKKYRDPNSQESHRQAEDHVSDNEFLHLVWPALSVLVQTETRDNEVQMFLIRDTIDFFSVPETSCNTSSTSRNWWSRPRLLMTWAEVPVINLILYYFVLHYCGVKADEAKCPPFIYIPTPFVRYCFGVKDDEAVCPPFIYIPIPYNKATKSYRSNLLCYLGWLNLYAAIALSGMLVFKFTTSFLHSVPEPLQTIRAVELYSPMVLYLVLAVMAIVKNGPVQVHPVVEKCEGKYTGLFEKIKDLAKIRAGYVEGDNFNRAILFSAFASLPLWWQIVSDIAQLSPRYPYWISLDTLLQTLPIGIWMRYCFAMAEERIRLHVIVLLVLLGRAGWCSPDRLLVIAFAIRLLCAHALFFLMARFFAVAYGAYMYVWLLLEQNKVFVLLTSRRKFLKDLKTGMHEKRQYTVKHEEYYDLLTHEGVKSFCRVRKLLQKEHSSLDCEHYAITLTMVVVLVFFLMSIVLIHSFARPFAVDGTAEAAGAAPGSAACTCSSGVDTPDNQMAKEFAEHDILQKFDRWISNLLELGRNQACGDADTQLCVRLLLSFLCSLVYFLSQVVWMKHKTHTAQVNQIQKLETARMKASMLAISKPKNSDYWGEIEKTCGEHKAHFEQVNVIPRIVGINIEDNASISLFGVLFMIVFLTVIKSREISGLPVLNLLDDVLPIDILVTSVAKLFGLDIG